MAAPDVANVVSEVATFAAPVAAIGVAVLAVMVVLKGMEFFKSALDDSYELGAEGFSDEYGEPGYVSAEGDHAYCPFCETYYLGDACESCGFDGEGDDVAEYLGDECESGGFDDEGDDVAELIETSGFTCPGCGAPWPGKEVDECPACCWGIDDDHTDHE